MFSPHAYTGSSGMYDAHEMEGSGRLRDREIIGRLWARFPGLRVMPQAMYYKIGFTERHSAIHSPIHTFVKKYNMLVKKGYRQEVAYEKVVSELELLMERQRDDMRTIRSGALTYNGVSYLDRAQQIAELESSLKMQRFARDIPKWERA